MHQTFATLSQDDKVEVRFACTHLAAIQRQGRVVHDTITMTTMLPTRDDDNKQTRSRQ